MASRRKQPERRKPAKPSTRKATPASPTASRARARGTSAKAPPRTAEPAPPPQPQPPAPAPVTSSRPTMRTPELLDRIVDWISNGGTLRSFCRLQGSPSHVTVYAWADQDPQFAERFAKAKEIRRLMLEDEILDIADNTHAGEVVTEESTTVDDPDSGDAVPATKRTVRTEDMHAHRKLQIYAREKMLKAWYPDIYGDRVNHDHKSGGKSFDAMLRKAIGVGDDDEEPQQ